MKRSFTLIELLVVLVLIGFLVSIVAPTGFRLLNGVQEYLNKISNKSKIEEKRFNAFLTQTENLELNISALGAFYYKKKSNNNN